MHSSISAERHIGTAGCTVSGQTCGLAEWCPVMQKLRQRRSTRGWETTSASAPHYHPLPQEAAAARNQISHDIGTTIFTTLKPTLVRCLKRLTPSRWLPCCDPSAALLAQRLRVCGKLVPRLRSNVGWVEGRGPQRAKYEIYEKLYRPSLLGQHL